MRAAGGLAQIRASVRGRDRSSRPLVVTWRQGPRSALLSTSPWGDEAVRPGDEAVRRRWPLLRERRRVGRQA
jgi:hypothetical protein